MDSHMLIGRYSVFFISFLLLLLSASPPSLSQPPGRFHYEMCRSKPYKCGEQTEWTYPFWGADRPAFCGGGDQFKLTCESGQDGQTKYYYTSIQMGSQKFEAVDIDPTAYTMKMVPLDEGPDVCSREFNFTLDPVFSYDQRVTNITIFADCTSGAPLVHGKITCGSDGNYVEYYVGVKDEVLEQYQELHGCRRIFEMPAEAVYDERHSGPQVASGKGFNVSHSVSKECLTCLGSYGACGSNETTHEFTCFAPDNQSLTRWNWKAKLGIGISCGGIAVLLTLCCFICKLVRFSSIAEWKAKFCWLATKSDHDIEAFLRDHGALALKRYKFSDVKKMTNSFRVKLGQGGFGAVYKGKLLNGSSVAVKILTRSKGNGEEFINEVASISRTSHVNVVALLGFCIEGRKKVLIYEFMSNGSLDKFIYKKDQENILSLSWDNLYQIVIGIARGLEYLHRGCSTRILHFDIKPHNILLDENFCPKISDFGLAKLCSRKESIISMSDARGTIGYVAPEVWNRHFGGVSHKSDVYSYGMMLLEIVGERKNINAEASRTSEIYFPDWVYKKLEQGTSLGVDEEVTKEENEVIKRMTMVGLWCIQTLPNDRPTMSRVVEMLEGSMNSLEMPPKPVLSSPVRSIVESSSTVN